MSQPRSHSLAEAVSNSLGGYVVGLVTQLLVFPVYHVEVTLWQNVTMTFIFTATGIARSYGIRRLFNWIRS